jgi:hypothetical protein
MVMPQLEHSRLEAGMEESPGALALNYRLATRGGKWSDRTFSWPEQEPTTPLE